MHVCGYCAKQFWNPGACPRHGNSHFCTVLLNGDTLFLYFPLFCSFSIIRKKGEYNRRHHCVRRGGEYIANSHTIAFRSTVVPVDQPRGAQGARARDV